MHSYLQTKAVSLTLEAKYIRLQERKFARRARKARNTGRDQQAAYWEKNRVGQYLHRIGTVREEARVTNLARGFLRGYSYEGIERFTYREPNWDRVRELVVRYAEADKLKTNLPLTNHFDEWQKEGKEHVDYCFSLISPVLSA